MVDIKIRNANKQDLAPIIQLLADDPLGVQREDNTIPLNIQYLNAWQQISEDNNAEIFVVEANQKVIGVAQINYLQYLTYQGGCRAQIEGVRIDKAYQRHGIGKKLFHFLIEKAKQHNCHLIQLTTDKDRPDSLKFYESLGFSPTHIGMKLHFTINH